MRRYKIHATALVTWDFDVDGEDDDDATEQAIYEIKEVGMVPDSWEGMQISVLRLAEEDKDDRT